MCSHSEAVWLEGAVRGFDIVVDGLVGVVDIGDVFWGAHSGGDMDVDGRVVFFHSVFRMCVVGVFFGGMVIYV